MSLYYFITNILNVNEKDIDLIDSINTTNKNIKVFIKSKPTIFICPYCGSKMISYGTKNKI